MKRMGHLMLATLLISSAVWADTFTGYAEIDDKSFTELKGSGELFIRTSKVAEKTQLSGDLLIRTFECPDIELSGNGYLLSIKSDTMNLDGEFHLDRSNVKTVHAKGEFKLEESTVGKLQFTGKEAIICNSKVTELVVKALGNESQTVILEKNAEVQNIKFESGQGVVVMMPRMTHPKVSGGSIRHIAN